jgi:ankyrin repeat protein
VPQSTAPLGVLRAAAHVQFSCDKPHRPNSQDGNTPLHTAASRGHVDVAKLLIAHGAIVNFRTMVRSPRHHLRPVRSVADGL